MRYLLVLSGQYARQELHQCHFGAVDVVKVGELDASGSAANDYDALGNSLVDDNLSVRHHYFAICGEGWRKSRPGSRRDDHVLATDPFTTHGELVGSLDGRVAFHVGYPVPAEERCDTLGEALNYLPAAGDADCVVRFDAAHLDAVLGGVVDGT